MAATRKFHTGIPPTEPSAGGNRAPREAVRLVDLLDEDIPRGSRRQGTAPADERDPVAPARVDTAPEGHAPRHGGDPVSEGRSPRGKAVSPEGYGIKAIHPLGEGEMVCVVLLTPPVDEEGEGETPRRPVKGKIHLTVEQYAELGLRAGPISKETAEAVRTAGELCAAIQRGARMLEYGDRSRRRLARGLSAKGISRETADEAAAYLAEKGYIREEDTARRRVEQSLRKGWGPRRIAEDLRAQGFDSEATEAALAALEEVDFEEACLELLKKKYPALPTERGARQKLIAAMVRQGYGVDTVKAALRRAAHEE